jgi:hypothetical protein
MDIPDKKSPFWLAFSYAKFVTLPLVLFFILQPNAGAAGPQIVSTLDSVRSVLAQVGPALSAVLFILAGIFYAIGQMLPPDKKANFHTAAVNIVIGAIVVAVLSTAATTLAGFSTHLLGNFTQINATA